MSGHTRSSGGRQQQVMAAQATPGTDVAGISTPETVSPGTSVADFDTRESQLDPPRTVPPQGTIEQRERTLRDEKRAFEVRLKATELHYGRREKAHAQTREDLESITLEQDQQEQELIAMKQRLEREYRDFQLHIEQERQAADELNRNQQREWGETTKMREWEEKNAAHERELKKKAADMKEWEATNAAHERELKKRAADMKEWEEKNAEHERELEKKAADMREWEEKKAAHESEWDRKKQAAVDQELEAKEASDVDGESRDKEAEAEELNHLLQRVRGVLHDTTLREQIISYMNQQTVQEETVRKTVAAAEQVAAGVENSHDSAAAAAVASDMSADGVHDEREVHHQSQSLQGGAGNGEQDTAVAAVKPCSMVHPTVVSPRQQQVSDPQSEAKSEVQSERRVLVIPSSADSKQRLRQAAEGVAKKLSEQQGVHYQLLVKEGEDISSNDVVILPFIKTSQIQSTLTHALKVAAITVNCAVMGLVVQITPKWKPGAWHISSTDINGYPLLHLYMDLHGELLHTGNTADTVCKAMADKLEHYCARV